MKGENDIAWCQKISSYSLQIYSTLALLSSTVSEINLQGLKGFYKAPDV